MAHRLFFALWPNDADRQVLVRNVAPIVASVGGRPTRTSNLHATLVFLGSVSDDQLPLVHSIASNVSAIVSTACEPIQLTFDRIEHWRKPQVVVATASRTPPAATALAEVLGRDLVSAGFTPDLKPFRAHITLARKIRRIVGVDAANIDSELTAPSTTLNFRDFSLVESRTVDGSSTYSVRAVWPLCAR
jgi:2'-5' RNA ligase